VALEIDWLAARLRDPDWFGWWPILTQMLGIHDAPAAQAIVRARAFDVPAATRAPWLMALVEVDGAAGIDHILSRASGQEEARAAIRAFVAHADPENEQAPALAAAIKRLATGDPNLAAEAVAGLRALGDWSFSHEVAAMLAGAQVADPAAAFALKSYLATARRKEAPGMISGAD